LFAANGFTGTTTKQIAKAAGGSEALRFKHFPTKQALCTAILQKRLNIPGCGKLSKKLPKDEMTNGSSRCSPTIE
jgi:AcrR family transcriptional regulator